MKIILGVNRYTTTKNRKNTTERLELSKYCPHCKTHTLHKEIKIMKMNRNTFKLNELLSDDNFIETENLSRFLTEQGKLLATARHV